MDSIKIEIDDKKFVGYLESWLEDFQEVSRTFGKTLNADRIATLKIPEGEISKVKKLQHSLEKLAERKFFIENVPDFSAIVSSLKSVNDSLRSFKFPESIKVDSPEIKIPSLEKSIDLTPLKEAIYRLEHSLQEGLRISNLDEIPLVFSKAAAGTSSGGGGDASEASLQSIIAQLVILNAAVGGGLTDTQLRAAPVPVSATDLDIRPLVNTDVVTAELSAADNAVLDTIDAVLDTIKVDTAAIKTAVELLDNAISGLEMQVDVVAGLPAGNNNIGDVDVVTLPSVNFNDVSITGQGSQLALGNNIILASAGTDSYDTRGTNGAAYKSVSLAIIPAAGTVTAGVVTFEGSNDNVNFVTIPLLDAANVTAAPVTSVTIAASTNRFFFGALPYRYFRARISTGITGTTTGVQCFSLFSLAPFSSV